MKKHIAFILTLLMTVVAYAESQPNVLWILTDDHRYDSIRAFNKMLTGEEMSPLGYVESPQTDRLAEMGTTFVNAYCQAQGCAPSRASMHYGRYPFRSGVYEFEYHNNNAEHCKPTLPERMAELGYQTTHVGKLGVRVKTIKGSWAASHKIYETDFYFKDTAKDNLTDWGKEWTTEFNGVKLEKPIQSLEFFVTPEGGRLYCDTDLEKLFPEIAGSAKRAGEDYDLLRFYKPKTGKVIEKSMIIGGVSPQPAGKTRDGYYASIFADYLKNANQSFQVGSQSFEGVDSSKPLFCHLGFDFPHTPVLPPADYRARFATKKYTIPAFDDAEYETMPKQLQKQAKKSRTEDYPESEKLSMIQDYYAFCAYGDALVGQAADAFVDYSEAQKQPWMIVYVCGDHGWKLNDHGAVSKFTPWDIDSHNPIVVVSSDKKKFPAGKVVRDYAELVDIKSTILAAAGADLAAEENAYLDGFDLAEIAAGRMKRDYVIGESHAVIGPRAFIRTQEYVFSMQTRPDKKRGANMDWALTASWKELDPALYHMTSDPGEVNNLAFNPEYQHIAMAMKEKLMNIVLGDNRVEVNWGGNKATGTEVFRSNFAPGADDKILNL